ncbi:MAG: hypothetical protein JO251_16350 [Verrucomicrobia bacterium]|nr:hypothetical protein [Verrucomicrobiota bacterium]
MSDSTELVEVSSILPARDFRGLGPVKSHEINDLVIFYYVDRVFPRFA